MYVYTMVVYICGLVLCVCVANKSKVLWGIPRDPDIVAALQELEDEENEMMADDEKPKVHPAWCSQRENPMHRILICIKKQVNSSIDS